MIGFAQGELLGQLRPVDTSAALIYPASLRTEILLISAVVLTGSPTIELFHDDEGSSFDDARCIYRGEGGEPFIFQARSAGGGIMIKPGGALAVRTSIADAVTFSVYGITAQLADRTRGM